MRLLDTHTGQFVEKDPEDKNTKFAILSHTWDPKGEQTFKQLKKIQKRYVLQSQSSQPGAGGSQPVSSPVQRGPLDGSASSSRLENECTTLPLDSPHPAGGDLVAERDDAPDDARESRPGRALKIIYQFILLAVFLPLYLQPTSSPVSPGGDITQGDSPIASYPTEGSSPQLAQDDGSRASPRSIWDDPELSPKIREACRVAREAGYRYLWIDSCCIDKTSSSEQTESINSMYLWYGRAGLCYAYLADVPSGKNPHEPYSAFRSSRWHKRGWTLQELIAPSGVTFLADDWTEIGGKHTLFELIEEITGIPYQALLHLKSLGEFSVAQRLSWAARRQTSREEDRAYSLLGIFNIYMPTLYGEGSRAFRRLQEEIVRRIPDLSLFAWNRHIYRGCNPNQDLVQALENAQSFTKLTSSSTPFDSDISDFESGEKIRAIAHDDLFHRLKLKDLPAPEYTFTPHGIRTKLPVVPLSIALPERLTEYDSEARSQWYLVILGCEHDDLPGALLGQACRIPPSNSGVEHLYHKYVGMRPDLERHPEYYALFPLSPATIARCREHIAVKTVYISEPERAPAQSQDARRQRHKTLNLMLLKNTRDALRAQGYTAELRGPDESHPNTHWLTLSNDDHRIAVEYQHTLEDKYYIQRLRIEANVKVLQPAPGLVEEMEVFSGSMEWSDHLRAYWIWHWSLPMKKVVFTLAAQRLTVLLALDWAGPSHYILRVGVVTKMLQDTALTSSKSAHAEELQASGADDEQGAQDVEAEGEGSGGRACSAIDGARLGLLDLEGSTGVPDADSGGEGGVRSESHGGDVDGEAEGEGGVSA
ncbi:hypothetical protein BD310DRAFT_982665 [Dichomitus squalens]|uniref:Uncharacterized protein n=1 Tax=Dichomitus squalens TaxID=114155 RepID=A0A4Q9P9P4_9APHY|nr:hypothetical protein BD310DRAFT_982665 [Dichomitus squalens]